MALSDSLASLQPEVFSSKSVSSPGRCNLVRIPTGLRQICAILPLSSVYPSRRAQFAGRAFSELSTSRRNPHTKHELQMAIFQQGQIRAPHGPSSAVGPTLLKLPWPLKQAQQAMCLDSAVASLKLRLRSSYLNEQG
jgi:hypothetical protein